MFGAGTSPMMGGTSSIVKAPQEARGQVWAVEILSLSPEGGGSTGDFLRLQGELLLECCFI